MCSDSILYCMWQAYVLFHCNPAGSRANIRKGALAMPAASSLLSCKQFRLVVVVVQYPVIGCTAIAKDHAHKIVLLIERANW